MTIRITVRCEEEVPDDYEVQVLVSDQLEEKEVETLHCTLEEGESTEAYIHSNQKIVVKEVKKEE